MIEAGAGTIDAKGFAAELGADTVKGFGNGPPFSYTLTGLPSASVAVVSQAAMDGGNGGWAVLYGSNPVTAGNLNLAIDEDQAGNLERNHTTEQVAYVVFH